MCIRTYRLYKTVMTMECFTELFIYILHYSRYVDAVFILILQHGSWDSIFYENYNHALNPPVEPA